MKCICKSPGFIILNVCLMTMMFSPGYGMEQSAQPPKFHVYNTNANVEEAFEGLDIKHTFIVNNHGLGELKLQVRPACGCSVAEYDEVIPPGNEGKISIVIKGYKVHAGFNKKSFTVTTNDPENKRVLLFVTATAKKVFNISNRLNLTGFPDEKLRAEAMLTNALDNPVRIVDWYWSENSRELDKYKDRIDVDIEEIENGRKYRLVLKQTREIATGHYMGELVLATDFDKVREKRLPVTLTVTPIVNVSPSKIYFGEMRAGNTGNNTLMKKFRLIAMKGDTLKLLEVVPSRNDMEVTIRELGPGRIWEGTVKIAPADSVVNYNATLELVTNYPGYERFEIAVEGFFNR